MGWFDSWFGSDASSTSDPLKSLDPKLREFLERESPVKIQQADQAAAAEAAAAAATAQAQSQKTKATHLSQDGTAVAEGQSDRPKVPKESLFQDGRYAHLWKTYRPYSEIEAETKTDHEKLMDVLDGYKQRKHEIGRAALENCAIQQEQWVNCMKSGDWEDRMQMCRRQVQRFERCYTMQTRFLKALGYQSVYERPAQVDEDIQMHADALYNRMLEQEKAIEAAKKEGLPVPKFDLSIPNAAARAAVQPRPDLEKSWKEKLEQLPEEERVAEEAALRADLLAKAEVAKNVQKLWDEQEKERKQRKIEGNTTIVDRVWSIFGGK